MVMYIRSESEPPSTLKDVYPMPRQEDLIAMISGCKYITIVDAVAMFFQWRVKTGHQNRLCVISHRGHVYNLDQLHFQCYL